MIYRSCSIDEVIARIIRNTRINDVSYIQDMNEWIPEAMGLMKTQYQKVKRCMDVELDFHKAPLPCGLVSLEAVEHNGQRLSYSSTAKHYKTGHNLSKETPPNAFISEVLAVPNTVHTNENSLLWRSTAISETDLLTACSGPVGDHWYQTEMDWINSSICDGILRLYYYQIPLDEKGLPLIPDNEDYKQALYYYTRAMMVGAGYRDKLFSYEQLMQHFEVHAARAIGQIRYPSTDMKEQQLKTQVRFIPPANYWENFFKVSSPETITS